ncbi:hypothetical protein ACH5RR_030039 [Cinchona calisaya]|uniref:ribose-5-phosphate isomerase n=1 Tax=Cinchona calisaya TaxID=153742 RepID=A0ABD2YUN6_9GENT
MAIAYPHYLSSKNEPKSVEQALMVSSTQSSSSNRTHPVNSLTQDELKKIAAYKAVEFVQSGMVLGLGTGSTARHAVDRIAELMKLGKLTNIVGIPTSNVTRDQAVSLGIPLSDLDTHPIIDMSIDGADEVDPEMNLVKGRGGSLLREKMVEAASKKFIVIVDESKLVNYIGGSGLAMPVEIVPFCWKFTLKRLEMLFMEAGCVGKLRMFAGREEPFVTDNGNYIIDLYFKKDIGDLKASSDAILRLAGVVEHGMFLDMATTLIVAGELGVTRSADYHYGPLLMLKSSCFALYGAWLGGSQAYVERVFPWTSVKFIRAIVAPDNCAIKAWKYGERSFRLKPDIMLKLNSMLCNFRTISLCYLGLLMDSPADGRNQSNDFNVCDKKMVLRFSVFGVL